MNDSYTSTTSEPERVFTLEYLQKVLDDLRSELPRLLYHTSKFLPVVDKDGDPMMMQISPTKMDAATREVWGHLGLEDYVLIHPDNLPYLKRCCAGVYRLEPLVATPIANLPES